jgi:hypothetical protein
MPVVALVSVIWCTNFGPATILRAMEAPGLVFAGQCAAVLGCGAFGVPATWALGVRGALWSTALSSGLGVALTVFLLRRKVRSASVGSVSLAPPSTQLQTFQPSQSSE